MPRKLLGFLLIVSWVILSGVDLVQDLKLPNPVQINALPDHSAPKTSPGLAALNNIVESADHKRLPYATLFDSVSVNLFIGGAIVFKKVFRLHKLHRVFLI
jgi:hypothetical protein